MADDDTMIALCQLAHQQRDAFHGVFKTWTQADMRAWLEGQIADHRARYEHQRSARGEL